jgi:hypothetical protein
VGFCILGFRFSGLGFRFSGYLLDFFGLMVFWVFGFLLGLKISFRF